MTVLCWARLDQDDPDNIETDIDTSDQEWDDDSVMRCDACGHCAKSWTFAAGIIIDPQTSVAAVLRAKGIRVYNMAGMLDRIRRHLGIGHESRPGDMTLRVGDLAGKTYDDIDYIAGIGVSTMDALVRAGLIPGPDPDK